MQETSTAQYPLNWGQDGSYNRSSSSLCANRAVLAPNSENRVKSLGELLAALDGWQGGMKDQERVNRVNDEPSRVDEVFDQHRCRDDVASTAVAWHDIFPSPSTHCQRGQHKRGPDAEIWSAVDRTYGGEAAARHAERGTEPPRNGFGGISEGGGGFSGTREGGGLRRGRVCRGSDGGRCWVTSGVGEMGKEGGGGGGLGKGAENGNTGSSGASMKELGAARWRWSRR